MKLHRYLVTWFEVNAGGNSYPKFEAGKSYAITEETTRHWAQGVAEEVDVEVSAEDAAATAEKAAARLAKAQQVALDAQALAEAAAQAEIIAATPVDTVVDTVVAADQPVPASEDAAATPIAAAG